ncbi:thioesterase family protein [Nocardioides panacisoli]|uniref:thioesterase family protein n=1 Tax=Nocardioides panacisoli TaxID=627624 RepID=UPI001C6265D7|nr:thioesterase family protein [Nocardioides panacisoli]QYJ04116.1 thioesterase family protein [Nocardioides panacisoli]
MTATADSAQLAEFDRDAAVTPSGEGIYAADLPQGWHVGGGINGGFQLAVIANAIRAELPEHPDPLAISAYYLSPATPGPGAVDVTVKRQGRSASTVAAELRQGDDVRLTTLATYGDLGALPEQPPLLDAEPLRLPPVEDCVSNELAPADFRKIAPLIERFDMHFHPDQVGFFLGEPTGRGELSCWFRLKDGREPDPISLLFAVDAMPPVSGDLGLPGWAPTLELSAYVRRDPAPGWLRLVHRTRHVSGGQFEEDCEVWDSADNLVAQSRQLARLPR